MQIAYCKNEINKKSACPERHLKPTANVLVFLLLDRTFIVLRYQDEIHLTFRKIQSVYLVIGDAIGSAYLKIKMYAMNIPFKRRLPQSTPKTP